MNAAQKALAAYVLQNGYSIQTFTGSKSTVQLDIDLLQGLDCSDDYFCKDNDFYYQIYLEEGYYGVLVSTEEDKVNNFALVETNADGSKNYLCSYVEELPKSKLLCQLLPQLIPGNWTIF